MLSGIHTLKAQFAGFALLKLNLGSVAENKEKESPNRAKFQMTGCLEKLNNHIKLNNVP